MSLIIECAGAPGSGKTTSCLHFMETLRSRNRVVYGRSDLRRWLHDRNVFQKAILLLSTVLFKTQHLLLFFGFLLSARMVSRQALYRFLRLCFFDVALRQFVKSKTPDFMILDQWAVQDIWSAMLFHKRTNRLQARQLRMFLGKPDVLLYFDADAATAARRIALRENGLSRFDNMDDKSRQAALEQNVGFLDALFDASACRNKRVLDAQKPPSENADLVLYYLNKMEQAAGFPRPVVVFDR